jgi:phosphomannomutase/phosphoglucomutase
MIFMEDKIFREYDIRGIAGNELTDELAFTLGNAFGSLLVEKNPGAGSVSVGRDARLSSLSLAEHITQGIIATGVSVVDVGLCPTPLQYFSIHTLNLDGGIMVTGSHNPPEYNGFKISFGRETIFGQEIQGLKKKIKSGEKSAATEKGKIEEYDIISAYTVFMKERFSYLSNERYRRLKIVVDAGNGTGGIVAPDIFTAMGCDVVQLYCEPDGRFPNHHPDPTVIENIQDLIRKTHDEQADIGIGYDGDSDRIGVINRGGRIIWGDQIMIILSREILRRKPGSTIIGDVKCSQIMFDDIQKHGGRPVMWKTGHSLVKDKMGKEHAVLAGEFSGHIFIADNYFGFDDALYTSFRLIEIMKISGMGIDALLSDIPQMHSTPEIRIDCPDSLKKAVVAELVQRCKEYALSGAGPLPIKKIYDIDGARVVFEKGWGLVRSSNTQPVIVMRFEAEDEEALRTYKSFLTKELETAMKTAAGSQ